MIIKKMGYSRNPWQLLTSDGRQVKVSPVVFDHPDLGKIMVDDVVSGKTKEECLNKALNLLETIGVSYAKLKAENARLKAELSNNA